MKLLNLNEAAEWASSFTGKKVTPTNISYLIQYGKVKKYSYNGKIFVDLNELKNYYETYYQSMRYRYEEKLGNDINWALSFAHLKEKDTTKHVHRLHPYKGKFIPQLVEYFLDDHTDSFKTGIFFRPGDIVLDPFAGSGTTLVQACELGIHSIGIDISHFNCLIAESKLLDYDPARVWHLYKNMEDTMSKVSSGYQELDRELADLVSHVNARFFPAPEYRYNLQQGIIKEEEVVAEATAYLEENYRLLLSKFKSKFEREFNLNFNLNFNFDFALNPDLDLNVPVPRANSCKDDNKSFLQRWLAVPALQEVLAARDFLTKIPCSPEKKLLSVILSRTVRSCRLTPHYQLETLEQPVTAPYYCYKHKQICRPVLSVIKTFNRYARDTLARLAEFKKLKKPVHAVVIAGDARQVDIWAEIKKRNQDFYQLLVNQKIKGIFTSPPYVGQLDYHEQHEYAYELFGFPRYDEKEIGKAGRGKNIKARNEYIVGISDVLLNCLKYLSDDAHIFIVANDKYNLYPQIAERAGLRIVKEYKRPVLNRTARDRNPYGEIIFHMVKNDVNS